MFYIQTQDGDLPYVYRTYKTQKGARKAAIKFLAENRQDGAIAVVTAMHHTTNLFARNRGEITEDVCVDDWAEYKEVYHGYEVAA
jgi:hypothetical protein